MYPGSQNFTRKQDEEDLLGHELEYDLNHPNSPVPNSWRWDHVAETRGKEHLEMEMRNITQANGVVTAADDWPTSAAHETPVCSGASASGGDDSNVEPSSIKNTNATRFFVEQLKELKRKKRVEKSNKELEAHGTRRNDKPSGTDTRKNVGSNPIVPGEANHGLLRRGDSLNNNKKRSPPPSLHLGAAKSPAGPGTAHVLTNKGSEYMQWLRDQRTAMSKGEIEINSNSSSSMRVPTPENNQRKLDSQPVAGSRGLLHVPETHDPRDSSKASFVQVQEREAQPHIPASPKRYELTETYQMLSSLQGGSSSSGKTEKNPSVAESSRRHKKSSSISSKVGEYLGNSADLLDSTRRGLTANIEKTISSKIRPAFGILDHYAQGHGDKDTDSDSDSDESFCCIGERRMSELERTRRFSGSGTDPWVNHQQDECRLCYKACPAGIRGLCLDCEEEFRRPITSMPFDDDDEVELPAPLKIRKLSTLPKPAEVKITNQFSDEKFILPATSYVANKPQFMETERHYSYTAMIEGSLSPPSQSPDIIHAHERWQTPEIRAQYEKNSRDTTRWSESLLDHQVETIERGSERISLYERWQTPDLRAQYKENESKATRWSASLLDSDPDEKMADASKRPSLQSKFSEVRASRKGKVVGESLIGVGEDRRQGKQRRDSRDYKQ